MKALLLISLLILISCGKSSDDNLTSSDSIGGGCTECRVFITNSTYDGNLGGISGADAKCASDSNNPDDGKVFKALIVGGNRRACISGDCVLSGRNENRNWVLKPNTKYIYLSTNNEFLSTNSKGVADFIMLASNTDSAFADRKVWTGIAYESSGLISTINWTTSSDTCSNWTDENAIGGLYGISD